MRKQTYELELRSADGARALQARVDRIHREQVTGLLEQVMSSVSPSGEVRVIERLELDLGAVAPEEVEEQLAERVGAELRRMLVDRGLAGADGVADEDGEGRTMSPVDAKLEALRTFLHTGLMPWWSSGTQRDAPPALLEELLDQRPGELRAMLQGLPPVGARRLSRQFSDRQVRGVIRLLAGASAVAVERVTDEWLAYLREAADRIPLSRRAAQVTGAAALEVVLAGETEPAAVSRQIAEQVARESGRSPTRIAADHSAAARGSTPSAASMAAGDDASAGPSPEAARRSADDRGDEVPGGPKRSLDASAAGEPPPRGQRDRERASPRNAQEPSPPGDADPAPAARVQGQSLASPAPGREAPARSQASLRSDRGRGSEEGSPPPTSMHEPSGAGRRRGADAGLRPIEDAHSDDVTAQLAGDLGLLVGNAGLVLAWPFLPRFFTELGLLDGERFVDEAARERAVLLLEYFATGEADAPEQGLALDKLLCGWPLEEPVSAAIDVRSREQREVAQLFASILENWKALGSTSADGLRRSFLLREGSLTHQEMGWNLRVARTGYDVLLDQLPWGIGFIVQPWMAEPLVVEW